MTGVAVPDQTGALLGTITGASLLTQVEALRPMVSAKSAITIVPEKKAASTVLTAEQEALLLAHLPIVRYVARSIHDRLPQHIELEELVSAGTLGLLDAARATRSG